MTTYLNGYGAMLLAGVVGSTAYGLSGPASDVDRLGMFAAPTRALLGLRQPSETRVTTKPDATFHEAGKTARLIWPGIRRRTSCCGCPTSSTRHGRRSATR